MNIRAHKILPLFIILLLSSCGIFKHHKNTALTDSEKLENTSLFVDGCKEKILGDYDKAMTDFQACIKADPLNSGALYELAGMYYLQKKDKEALSMIEKAVKLEPANVWYKLLNANLLIAANRYKDALNIYEDLTKTNPDNLDYFLDLAEGYLYLGKYTDAIRVYDEIEKKTGINEDISLQKEKIYLALKKFDKAAAEIQKLIDAFPSETSYYNYLADLYLTNDMADKAFELYQKVLTLDPANANVHLSLAEYYRSKGEKDKFFDELKLGFSNPDLDIDTEIKILLSYYSVTENYSELKTQAYELLDLLIKAHPDEAKAYSIYGDFLYRDKRDKEARGQYLKVITLDSSKYAIWEQLLLLDSELNNYDSLETESQRAIELFPEHASLYLFNGAAKYLLKKYDEAIITLNKGILLVIGDDNLLKSFYTFLGNSYYGKKDLKNAFSFYDKVLDIDPKDSEVLNNYSYYLSLNDQDLDKAEKLAKKAVDIESDNPSFLDTYGWVLYKQAKYSEAETWIKKALENEGDSNPVILEHYGDIMFKLGNTEKALEYWKEAKEKGKGSEFLEKKINDKKLYE
jgi:tetratricopeptide (TPR) repeat protein